MKMRTYINSRNVRANTVRGIPKKQPPAPQGAFGNLIPDIQRAVAAEGYETPTPIQEQCIPHLLKGRDLLGTAQTGTGKTAAFTLPLLQRLSDDTRRPQRSTPRALILAPTRELAAQIGASIRVYGRFVRVNHTLVHGGVSQFAQIKALKHGVDILVATPGRLLDLMEQGHIHLDQVEVFILDEVDRMLDMGFIPDIKRVLSKLPEDRQTLFFSATIPPKIVALAHAMVVNPVQIVISPDQPAVELIAQKVLFVGKESKDALLISLLRDKRINKALIFTQMKHAANRVAKKLHAAGIQGTAIHGNKSQAARTRALDGFKRGRFRVLVATDVAARGLDVDDINPCYQLRPAPGSGNLRAPHRANRTGGGKGRCHLLLQRRGTGLSAGHRAPPGRTGSQGFGTRISLRRCLSFPPDRSETVHARWRKDEQRTPPGELTPVPRQKALPWSRESRPPWGAASCGISTSEVSLKEPNDGKTDLGFIPARCQSDLIVCVYESGQ